MLKWMSYFCATLICVGSLFVIANTAHARADALDTCTSLDIYARATVAALDRADQSGSGAAHSITQRAYYISKAIDEYKKLDNAIRELPYAGAPNSPPCQNYLALRYWEMLDYWAQSEIAEAMPYLAAREHDGDCKKYLRLQGEAMVANAYAFLNSSNSDGSMLATYLEAPNNYTGYPGHPQEVDKLERVIATAARGLRMVLPDETDAKDFAAQKKSDLEVTNATLPESCSETLKGTFSAAVLVLIFSPS